MEQSGSGLSVSAEWSNSASPLSESPGPYPRRKPYVWKRGVGEVTPTEPRDTAATFSPVSSPSQARNSDWSSTSAAEWRVRERREEAGGEEVAADREAERLAQRRKEYELYVQERMELERQRRDEPQAPLLADQDDFRDVDERLEAFEQQYRQSLTHSPSRQEAHRTLHSNSNGVASMPKYYDESSYEPASAGASCGLCTKLKEVFSGSSSTAKGCLPTLPKPSLHGKAWAKTAGSPTAMPWPLMDSFSGSGRSHLKV